MFLAGELQTESFGSNVALVERPTCFVQDNAQLDLASLGRMALAGVLLFDSTQGNPR
jgi:hypothetical protein